MSEHTQDTDMLQQLGDPEAARALEGTLALLEKETELLLFTGPRCPRCPHMLRSAATVALASPRVVLEVVDASREPELAAHYEVTSVPTTVVDDAVIMMGIVAPDELALRLVERQGPEQAKRIFAGLVGGGHTGGAAERLADGRGTDAFLELWADADAERRLALMAVAEESLLYDPFGTAPVAERLLAALDGDGAVASDEAHAADTVELLGRIGDDDLRPALERLADDPRPAVAGEARKALASL